VPSRMWNREDLRNILLAIYAARFSLPLDPDLSSEGPEEKERLYCWGFRTATQALLMAFGLPLQLLDRRVQQPVLVADDNESTHVWWIEDLENIIAAVYRSAISASLQDLDEPALQEYRRGFGEVIAAVLEAIGSHQEPQRWYEQVQADRYWVFAESDDLTPPPPKLVGSSPPEPALPEPSD
jgi:hypothetical protein